MCGEARRQAAVLLLPGMLGHQVFGGILGNVIENEDGSYGSDDRTSEISWVPSMRIIVASRTQPNVVSGQSKQICATTKNRLSGKGSSCKTPNGSFRLKCL